MFKVNVKEELGKYYSLNSKNLKLLLVGHSANLGGAEILLKNMISEFKNQNIEITVLILKSGVIFEEYKKEVPTFISDSEEKHEFFINELNKQGYKIAILNTVISGKLIPILNKYDYKTISLVHELPGVINILGCEETTKIIAEKADLVVFPSNFVAEKFETLNKVTSKKVIQPQGFYNTFDDFNYEKSRKILEKKYNIPKDYHIILNVGYGEERKGFDLFNDIATKLENEKFSFIWVGNISDKINEKYKETNIIMPGFIFDINELNIFYDACDLFLLTSREDPFPSVIFEAFNAGKPVIAFKDAGGFKDIVIDNETGYLVEYESISEMIDKIKLVCHNKKLNVRLGINAKKILKKYNFSNYVKKLLEYTQRINQE